MNRDVAVLGGGTSGTFAALELSRAGLDVVVVRSGPPSVAMCRGAAFIGVDPPGDDDFDRTWREVFPSAREGPDDFVGFDASVVRAARGVAGAARLSLLDADDVLVMDVPGLPGPDAGVLAAELSGRIGRRVRHSHLKLPYSADDFTLSPMLWARRFDDVRTRAELVSHLLRRLMDEPAGVCVLPPVLGIAFRDRLGDILEESAPARVVEMLGGPGWPPGHRLAAELEPARGSVEAIAGRVVEAETSGSRLEAVTTDGGERVGADRFVLATGGVVGGGLRLEDGPVEPALGLPVTVQGARVRPGAAERGTDPSPLFGRDPHGHQPILTAGVRVDEQMQPVDGPGRVLFSNLWACGDVVARPPGPVLDPGRSALSGTRAARRLLGEDGP
jgi:anaerobic glycerol-3-phosphate dehydrogenase